MVGDLRHVCVAGVEPTTPDGSSGVCNCCARGRATALWRPQQLYDCCAGGRANGPWWIRLSLWCMLYVCMLQYRTMKRSVSRGLAPSQPRLWWWRLVLLSWVRSAGGRSAWGGWIGAVQRSALTLVGVARASMPVTEVLRAGPKCQRCWSEVKEEEGGRVLLLLGVRWLCITLKGGPLASGGRTDRPFEQGAPAVTRPGSPPCFGVCWGPVGEVGIPPGGMGWCVQPPPPPPSHAIGSYTRVPSVPGGQCGHRNARWEVQVYAVPTLPHCR